ncbi:MAG: Gfo/Idh/MocA family oxidoreductase [Thermomicrobiales bacterium]|nr:Gfo/Idh/MocA family oxidoreductase [Thermomicrobiales bacterium]
MTKPVRFALLGLGQPHMEPYTETLLHLPETEVVAAYDWPMQARPQTLPESLAGMPIYTDVEALLDEVKPEAVLVCLPGKLVPGIVELAAARGIHVMAEKPCAVSAAAWLPAQRAIEASGIQFATGYVRHFSPAFVMMRQLVAEGIIGDLLAAETSFLTSTVKSRNPNHWFFMKEMNGGGILSWLGCHFIDVFRFVSGAEAVEVSAMLETRSPFDIDVEDFASLSIRYDNRMIATLHTGYVGGNRLDIGFQGSLGSFRISNNEFELQVTSSHPSWATAPSRTFTFDKGTPPPGYAGAIGVETIQRFINAFRAGGPPAFMPDDALRVLEVIDAAHQSSAEGRAIKIDHQGS